MAWYGLVWLDMAWCSGTFKLMSKSWRSGLEMPHAGQRWMMAMGPTAIRLFDLKYLGCLAVGQLEKPVVGEK